MTEKLDEAGELTTPTRAGTGPLYARAAKDNIGSRRVLEKCGFAVVGEDTGYAHARGVETEEVVLRLD